MTNETETRPEQAPTDAWRAALASRKTQVADPESIPSAPIAPADPNVSRRNFIRASFWGGLGITLLGSVGLLLDYLYPRNVRGFGGPVAARNVADYPRADSRSRTARVSSGSLTSTRPKGARTAPRVPRACWRCGGSVPTSAARCPGSPARPSRPTRA